MNALRFGVALALFSVAAGCDSSGPAVADGVVGTYSASILAIPGPTDSPVDAIGAGGSLVLTLDRDGSASGRLVVPDAVGWAADLPFSGTYEVSDAAVVLDVDPDPVSFTRFERAGAGRLTASLPWGFEAVLDRQ